MTRSEPLSDFPVFALMRGAGVLVQNPVNCVNLGRNSGLNTNGKGPADV